jgi:predicted DNA-binding transcriptional regulator AlpA
VRTDESTIALVRRLAALYPDAVIAGILNRQGRTTAQGHRFETGRVGNLRRHWQIPCFEPKAHVVDGELLTIKKAASALGVAPSTIHRLLNDGIIPGEQLTSGAPWRIRLTDHLIAKFNDEAGEGFMPMREAMRALGVSRQTVLQRVKRGELEACHVTKGKQKVAKRKSPPGKHWLAEPSASMARLRSYRRRAQSRTSTVSPPVEGTAPRCSPSSRTARLCPPMWGSNYLVDSPSRKSPSEILRFVDFPTSPESTPGANRQPVYRERIRECSIARPFPTGIASPKSRARESLMQPVRPHEAVESRSRAEGQQQYQKQCRDCHAPPICCPWSIQCW